MKSDAIRHLGSQHLRVSETLRSKSVLKKKYFVFSLLLVSLLLCVLCSVRPHGKVVLVWCSLLKIASPKRALLLFPILKVKGVPAFNCSPLSLEQPLSHTYIPSRRRQEPFAHCLASQQTRLVVGKLYYFLLLSPRAATGGGVRASKTGMEDGGFGAKTAARQMTFGVSIVFPVYRSTTTTKKGQRAWESCDKLYARSATTNKKKGKKNKKRDTVNKAKGEK